MTNNSLPMSQQMYFSTHNALRVNEEDDSINTLFCEMNGNRHISLLIFPFYDVQMLKRLLIKKLNLPRYIKVNDIIITYKGIKLPNYRIISTYLDNFNASDKKKKKKINKLFWAIKDTNPNVSIRIVDKSKNYPPFFENMLNEIKLAFKKNISPKLTMDGTGGTYLLYNGKKKICSVFKPIDEEAFAPFNPRGYEGKMYQQGFRAGVLSGEGASREIAAYLLDNTYNNFSNVPCTIMVEACHPNFNNKSKLKYIDDKDENNLKWKCGSLQEFVDSKESVGNYDHKQFSIRDIHKIAILDIRVMNLDRNDGNILVSPLKSLKNSCNQFLYKNKKFGDVGNDEDLLKRILTIDNKPSRYSLIPIDHGLILPHIMDVAEIDLVWFEWPQTKVPFDNEELLVIFTFDPDKDAEKIRKKLLIREECIRTMRVCTRLLQIGAKMHLNLHEIAKISTRKTIDEESILEHLVKDSIVQAYQMMDCTALMSTNRLGNILDLAEIKINKKKKANKTKSIDISEDKLKKKSTDEKGNIKEKKKLYQNYNKDYNPMYEMKKENTIISFKEENIEEKQTNNAKMIETEKEKNILQNNSKDNKHLNEKNKKESDSLQHECNSNILISNANKEKENSSNIIKDGIYRKDYEKNKPHMLTNDKSEIVVNKENEIKEKKIQFDGKLSTKNCNVKEKTENQISKEYEELYKTEKNTTKLDVTIKTEKRKIEKRNNSNNSSDYTSNTSNISSDGSTSSSDSNSTSSSSSSSSSSYSSSNSSSYNISTNYTNAKPYSIHNDFGIALNKDDKIKGKGEEKMNEIPEKTELSSVNMNEEENNCNTSHSLFNASVEKWKHKKKKKKKKDKKKRKKEEDTGEEEDEEEDEEKNDMTFKKPTGTLKRINENAGTAYRNIEMSKINSIWMIKDKNNKIINVKWENQNFEKLFFETFENHVIKYINDNHPNWRNYEYYGNNITCSRHSYLNSIK